MTYSTASVVSHALLTTESFCIVILPVPVSTWSAADKVKTWTFLNKESEPMQPPPSQTGWLITIDAVQHVWRKMSEEHKFKFLETRNLNQDALENIFSAIHLHCGSNNNPSVGQFVDALKSHHH